MERASAEHPAAKEARSSAILIEMWSHAADSAVDSVHAPAAVHLGSVESNLAAVVLQNAVDEPAVDEMLVVELHRLAAKGLAFNDLHLRVPYWK